MILMHTSIREDGITVYVPGMYSVLIPLLLRLLLREYSHSQLQKLLFLLLQLHLHHSHQHSLLLKIVPTIFRSRNSF